MLSLRTNNYLPSLTFLRENHNADILRNITLLDQKKFVLLWYILQAEFVSLLEVNIFVFKIEL